MDVSDKDKVETDWQSGGASFANLLMGMVSDGNPIAACKGDHVSSSPLISMVDSFGPAPALWDDPANSQSMGFNSINNHSGMSTFEKLGLSRVPGSFGAVLGAGWEAPNQFPADSGFIERAARLSCFSSGNIADMVNPFGMNQPVNAYHQISMMSQEHQKNDYKGSPNNLESKNEGFDDDTKQAGSDTVNSASGGDQEEPSLINTGAEPSSAKALGPKKRKRGGQPSNEDVKGDEKQNSEDSPSNKENGENGKQNSQASDPPKEEYIHVRARRGQATNSHSLAERVRREKISERMKFLQDLVPGCSKVTGKAVMLDEIINYVQSLQRQVEFLSMKLATVNPRLDFNIESLLAKDHMFVARPPTMGFSPDMPLVYQQMHPSQPTVIQPSLPVIGTSSESLKNISSQLTSISEEYKEPAPQVQNIWDDELHNVVHMGFNSNTSPGNQEANSSLPQGQTKVEL